MAYPVLNPNSKPGISNTTNGSESWFEFLSRSNPVNENHGSSGSRSSSSTWPKNSDNHSIDASRHKTGDEVSSSSFDGRKESAVRGEGGAVSEARGEVDQANAPILSSSDERMGEGDVRNGQTDDARSDGDKT